MSTEQFIISSIFTKTGLNKANFYAAEELPAYSMPKATDKVQSKVLKLKAIQNGQ